MDVDDAMDSEAGETLETTEDTIERSTKDGCQQTPTKRNDRLLFVGSISKPGS